MDTLCNILKILKRKVSYIKSRHQRRGSFERQGKFCELLCSSESELGVFKREKGEKEEHWRYGTTFPDYDCHQTPAIRLKNELMIIFGQGVVQEVEAGGKSN